MRGERYASVHYGFSELVMQFMRNWFDDDDSSTPDVYGRKVWYKNTHGNKIHKVVRHMKAADREENHELFVKLRGAECLRICSDTVKGAGRKMKIRVPSRTVLESCRPNYAKYFKKSEFGDCSLCKPSYDNYQLFLRCVLEQKETISLPATVSLFVRSRVCRITKGDRRHECEDHECKHCSFVHYLVEDPTSSKMLKKKFSSSTTFEEEYGIRFLSDSIVEWN